MSAVQTMLAPPLRQSQKNKHKKAVVANPPPTTTSVDEFLDEENLSRWPTDILDAYSRLRGPYTAENAVLMLEEEPVELYNGWLVWQDMTNLFERRSVANFQEMLSLSARNLDFGQALPDQAECLLNNGDVVKPDACLLSWQRLANDIHYSGRRKRPLLNGGPELVIEVRSPSNRRAQEQSKRDLYFRNKVKVIWDVDDDKKMIWVYRAEAPDTPQTFTIDDTIDCEPFLPGWRRQLRDIFAERASAKAIAGEVAEAWHSEGKQEGFVEGKQKGFAEGETEGAAKTLRQVLPMMLQMRFQQTLPDDFPERLALCNLAQLQAMQSAILTSPTLHDWLALLPTK